MSPDTTVPTPRGPRVPPLRIDLWCNAVAGGWRPHDLETSLGGGEEAVALWARALATRGHRVRVFHNAPDGAATRWGGAAFLPHERFNPFARRDVLVSWKSPHPWRIGATASVRLHWSSDVEAPWSPRMLERLHGFVVLTPFHRRCMPWLPERLTRVIPLGLDTAHLDAHWAPREAGLCLYASSPDRGLETLLRDWPRIRDWQPGLRLEVCYGFSRLLASAGGSPHVAAFRERMARLLRQEGVTYRGALSRAETARTYWRAAYWMHPLNRAESELFCLNAVKARHCGVVGVVNRLGALQQTATRWIDYTAFREGGRDITTVPPYPAPDWDTVVRDYWEPLFAAHGAMEGRAATAPAAKHGETAAPAAAERG